MGSRYSESLFTMEDAEKNQKLTFVDVMLNLEESEGNL